MLASSRFTCGIIMLVLASSRFTCGIIMLVLASSRFTCGIIMLVLVLASSRFTCGLCLCLCHTCKLDFSKEPESTIAYETIFAVVCLTLQLDLADNYLEEMRGIGQAQGLHRLDISNNSIAAIEGLFF